MFGSRVLGLAKGKASNGHRERERDRQIDRQTETDQAKCFSELNSTA